MEGGRVESNQSTTPRQFSFTNQKVDQMEEDQISIGLSMVVVVVVVAALAVCLVIMVLESTIALELLMAR